MGDKNKSGYELRTELLGMAMGIVSERVQRLETNEHFAAVGSPGWKSDMGMIYILFGPPDDTQRSFSRGSRDAYETWYYYSINRNFSFEDDNGFGDYKLTTPYFRGVGW